MKLHHLVASVLAFIALLSAAPANALPTCGSRRWTFVGCSNGDGSVHVDTYHIHTFTGWHSCEIEGDGPCPTIVGGGSGGVWVTGTEATSFAQIGIWTSSAPATAPNVTLLGPTGLDCGLTMSVKVDPGGATRVEVDRDELSACMSTRGDSSCVDFFASGEATHVGLLGITLADGTTELMALDATSGFSLGMISVAKWTPATIKSALYASRAFACGAL